MEITEEQGALRELILKAKDGSQDALDTLLSKYRPLLESQISKHSYDDMTAQDVEDIRNEAAAVFCSAVCSYDTSAYGVEFGLYAKICVENGLTSFIRAYNRRRKRAVLPLEEAAEQSYAARDIEADPLQAIVDNENLSELVSFIHSNLSDYENRIWWMYVSGMGVSDISRAIDGKDNKSISNAIFRIRKKLRSFIEERQNEE